MSGTGAPPSLRLEARGTTRAGGKPGELRAGLLYCVGVFTAVRLALFVLGLLGVALVPVAASPGAGGGLLPFPVGVPGWPAHAITPGWHNVFTAWEREDALWFLRIATGGYATHDASAAFFPLYPLLVRWLSFAMGGHPLAAALLVSNGSFLAALMVLYALTRSELSEELARRSVLYAAVFPSALFFLAPYSESLFLLLVLVTFWAARRGRWELAGIGGLLAALTRNLGVLLMIPLAVEAFQRMLSGRPRRVPWAAVPAVAGPAVGLLGYLWYWSHRSGDWLAPLHQQSNWERHLSSPVTTLHQATGDAFGFLGTYPGGYHLLDWIIAAGVLLLAAYGTFRLRPPYWAFTWASVVLPLLEPFPGRPLLSFFRFALPLFPLYWAMALLTDRGRLRHEVAVALSASLLGLMTVLFVSWYYIL